MPAGWRNPKVQYDFTWEEWKDREENYPNLTWKEYREMKGYPEMTDDKIGNARHIEGATNKVDPVHYHFEIEPFDYIHDNDMGFAEGNVIKYITRWRYKDGLTDLYKAKQYLEMLIEKELKDDNN